MSDVITHEVFSDNQQAVQVNFTDDKQHNLGKKKTKQKTHFPKISTK